LFCVSVCVVVSQLLGDLLIWVSYGHYVQMLHVASVGDSDGESRS